MRPHTTLVLVISCLAAVLASSMAQAAPVQTSDINIQVDGWDAQVKLVGTPDGTMHYQLTWPDGRSESLTPLQFAKRHFRTEQSRSFINKLLNVTSPIGIAWVALGLFGQLLFTGRMLVQWLVSEKRRTSTVPVAFWWLSLGGASMLLAYFIWRRDIVGVLGQGLGWFIYIRNLRMIYRSSAKPNTTTDPDCEPTLEERAA